MENAAKKKAVALSSVLSGLVLTVMKLIVGLLTGSMGIISEAAHSALDFAAAILTYFAVKIGDRPADDTHPYGHGKVESVSALIETGLLFLTSAWIIYEAVHRLIYKGVEIQVTWYAFVIVIISILIDISRSRALYRVAKETGSQALEADALHFKSDIWSSLVVLLGLVFVAFGFEGADSIAALAVSLFVLVAGYRLGKRTIDVLVDTAPAGVAEIVKEIASKVPEIISVERIRVRPLGLSIFIEMSVKMSRTLHLEKAQMALKKMKEEIKNKIPESDLVVNTTSIQLDNETISEAVNVAAAKHGLSVHDVLIDNLKEKRYVSYDLEVPEDLTIEQAHELATHLEEEIKNELGSDVEIYSHIEPAKTAVVTSIAISGDEAAKIAGVIKDVAEVVDPSCEVHDVLARKVGDKLFVTMHCLVNKQMSLEVAHTNSSRMEYLIREKMPEIKKTVIHIEPK